MRVFLVFLLLCSFVLFASPVGAQGGGIAHVYFDASDEAVTWFGASGNMQYRDDGLGIVYTESIDDTSDCNDPAGGVQLAVNFTIDASWVLEDIEVRFEAVNADSPAPLFLGASFSTESGALAQDVGIVSSGWQVVNPAFTHDGGDQVLLVSFVTCGALDQVLTIDYIYVTYSVLASPTPTPSPSALPALSDVVGGVGDFVLSWGVFAAAGLVVGVGGLALSRLIRAGR